KIPNKAEIQLNDEPKVESNEVTVIPPTPVDPNIHKDVEGLDHIVVEEGVNYNYNVKTQVADDVKGYKDLTITDTLDKRLELVGYKVLVDGKASSFKAEVKGNSIKLVLTREQLNTVQGKEVNLQITAKLKDGSVIETVPNKSEIQLNDKPSIDSNEVTVIPPNPEEPNIVKDVEGQKHLEVEHSKEYNYNVKTVVPKKVDGYKHLTLSDTLDNRLDVVLVKVLVDDKEDKTLSAVIEGQNVKVTLTRDQLNKLAGKEVTMQITSKIKEGVAIETIPNKASVTLNDKPAIDSNEVT
ncbi:isopeptide-forming domain-containing fimbrial protein, partial [Bacillus cereus]|uniref:isopeptide-forming domain-containing fimbrial protein n=1 Tax=Bacillus cereus TaxID=1396 RepID=UPI003D162AB2